MHSRGSPSHGERCASPEVSVKGPTVGEVSKQPLSRLPLWVPVAAGAFGIAGLTALPAISDTSTGAWLWAARIALGLCGVFGVLAPVLQHLQAQQAARLDLRVNVSPGHILSFAALPEALERWAQEERTALQPKRPSVGRSAADGTSAKASGQKIAKAGGGPLPGDAELLAGLSIKDLIALEEREADTENPLDELEQEVLAASQRAIAPAVAKFSTASNQWRSSFTRVGLTGEPDNRSREEYAGQVQRYLDKATEQLTGLALDDYASNTSHALVVTVENPTGRPFESVVVELYIPGEIEGVEEADPPHDYAFQLPRRPWPFGKPRPWGSTLASRLVLPTARDVLLPRMGGGPSIDNSASARISWPEETLRPHSSVVLDPVYLVTPLPPGSTLVGSWSATATNAEGKLSDTFTLSVGDAYPVADVLARVTRPEDDDQG